MPDISRIEARFWAKVEKTETCWLWTAYCDRKGYGRFQVREWSEQYAYRVAYRLLVGLIPEGAQVDHVCHNHACVNPSHLRLATNKQNQENLQGARTISKSGVRGVHWRQDCKKWQAMVRHNGKLHHVGYFDLLEEAAVAVTLKRAELYTHNTDRVEELLEAR